MEAVAQLIAKMDTEKIETQNQMKIFQLKHILATQMQTILLRNGIHAQGGMTGRHRRRCRAAWEEDSAAGAAAERRQRQPTLRALQFLAIDPKTIRKC